jgi:DNA (cytosine-5)-methyltransferase 1
MFGGIPAFGAGRMSGSIEKAGTLTHHEGRNDLDSETFFVQQPHETVGTLAGTSPGGGWRIGADEAAAGHLVVGALRSSCGGPDDNYAQAGHLIAGTLNANGKAAGSATNQDAESGLLVVHGTQDPGVSNKLAFALGRNKGQENAVLAFSCKDHGADAGVIAPTLRAMNHSGSHANAGGQVAACITGDITHTLKAEGFDGSEDGTGRGQPIVAFTQNSRSEVRHIGGDGQIVGALAAEPGAQQQNYLAGHSQVRRLVPVECERLQGMADDYTLIPWRGKPASECPDGPRYKAIGNSKAVTVVRWIGRRLLAQLGNR